MSTGVVAAGERRRLLTQQRFPRLWLLFQHAVGGTADKSRVIRALYEGEKSVLEIGCSAGNTADVFRSIEDVRYCGLDIDGAAIQVAKGRFRDRDNFEFVHGDVAELGRRGRRFQLVLIAGVLHHLPDDDVIALVSGARDLVDDGGRLCIVEPLSATASDPPLIRFYANRLEQGEHLRSADALSALLERVPDLRFRVPRLVPISATPFFWPRCATFAVIEASKTR